MQDLNVRLASYIEKVRLLLEAQKEKKRDELLDEEKEENKKLQLQILSLQGKVSELEKQMTSDHTEKVDEKNQVNSSQSQELDKFEADRKKDNETITNLREELKRICILSAMTRVQLDEIAKGHGLQLRPGRSERKASLINRILHYELNGRVSTSDNALTQDEQDSLHREMEDEESEIATLQSEVTKLSLRTEEDFTLKQGENITDPNLGLELEIATYRKLLEGVESNAIYGNEN